MHDIRPARLDDARAIARVHVSSWRSTYDGIVPGAFLASLSVGKREARWIEILSKPSREHVALVAGDPVVGMLSAGPSREKDPRFSAELYAIYLRREAQGRGFGRALVGEFARRMLALGHRAAHVWVLAANPACGFYESTGARLLRTTTIEIGRRLLVERCYGWDRLLNVQVP